MDDAGTWVWIYQRSIDGLAYLRECAEVAVLGFVGLLKAVVNTRAVARYLGGNVVLSNLRGTTMGIASRRCAIARPSPRP